MAAKEPGSSNNKYSHGRQHSHSLYNCYSQFWKCRILIFAAYLYKFTNQLLPRRFGRKIRLMNTKNNPDKYGLRENRILVTGRARNLSSWPSQEIVACGANVVCIDVLATEHEPDIICFKNRRHFQSKKHRMQYGGLEVEIDA